MICDLCMIAAYWLSKHTQKRGAYVLANASTAVALSAHILRVQLDVYNVSRRRHAELG